jgi:hypothetical protein
LGSLGEIETAAHRLAIELERELTSVVTVVAMPSGRSKRRSSQGVISIVVDCLDTYE